MECPPGYACLVSENSCDEYECIAEAVGCPDGYTFTSFLPSLDFGETSTSSSGYYCEPIGHSSTESFSCYFDESDNFSLKVNAMVPEIRNFQEWDDREITIISKDEFDVQNQSLPFSVFGFGPKICLIGCCQLSRIIFDPLLELADAQVHPMVTAFISMALYRTRV